MAGRLVPPAPPAMGLALRRPRAVSEKARRPSVVRQEERKETLSPAPSGLPRGLLVERPFTALVASVDETSALASVAPPEPLPRLPRSLVLDTARLLAPLTGVLVARSALSSAAKIVIAALQTPMEELMIVAKRTTGEAMRPSIDGPPSLKP